jgi:hypothetical protein
MNVLSDFEIRINRMCPATDEQIEILKLDSQIKARDEMIVKLTDENVTLRKKLEKSKPAIKKVAKVKEGTKTTSRTLAEIAAEAIAKSKVTAATTKEKSKKRASSKGEKRSAPVKSVEKPSKTTAAGKAKKAAMVKKAVNKTTGRKRSSK